MVLKEFEPHGPVPRGGATKAIESGHDHSWQLVEVHYDMEPSAEEYVCTQCAASELRLADQRQ